jgi:Zn finger protein HypA/HybF involved in hydrogenase expression
MGSSVKAKCPCGFKAESMIGGGMLDHLTTCLFPCLCETCKDMVTANLYDEKITCPECNSPGVIPYDDPRLQGDAGTQAVAGWNTSDRLGRELALMDGTYKCPKCGSTTLRFEQGGILWD